VAGKTVTRRRTDRQAQLNQKWIVKCRPQADNVLTGETKLWLLPSPGAFYDSERSATQSVL